METKIFPIIDPTSIDDNNDTCLSEFPNQSFEVDDQRPSSRNKFKELVDEGSWFETFILAVIVLNSITMACIDYTAIDDNYNPSTKLSTWNAWIEKLEFVFLAIFVFECVLKISTQGFFRGENAYLHDNWNKFDLLVVILRYVIEFSKVSNFLVRKTNNAIFAIFITDVYYS